MSSCGTRYAYGKRHMNNIDELIRLVEAYNMTYTHVIQPMFARFRVC